MAKTMAAQNADWEAQSDVRTLTEAAEIRKDKKRLARARKKAREMMKALEGAQQ